MNTLLVSALFFFSYNTAQAQLYVENRYDVDFYVAIAYYQSGTTFSGWISKGWVKLKPGETQEVLHFNPTGKKIYLHAYSEIRTIQGSQRFLIDTADQFRIKGADQEKTSIDNPAYEWRPFYEIKRGMSRNFKNKETLQLMP